VSLSDVELNGFEKVKDMEEWVGGDLIGSSSRFLIRSVCADID
jgi:hypothetical protein